MKRRKDGTADFGDAARRRSRFISPGVLLVSAIALGGAMEIGIRLAQEPETIAEAARWTVPGPPCPAVTASAFAASPVKVHMDFQYDDVNFGRGYGHVYCDEIYDDGGRGFGSHPVCQFTAPAILKVTTPKGEFRFFPSTGPATVAVPDGVPTCVRAGWFKGIVGQW